ncbi:hypothetical protein, partial [Paenibacillus koleovorans]|uniref:hypothetical protein n=1 Tax=Paenibacillus koleovorans TaxID=121608 RepID=UPI001C3F532B
PYRPKAPPVVTQEMVANAMKDAPLQTQQTAVSLSAIQRYVDRIVSGDTASAINVDDGIIVDGNYRCIAGRIMGIEPAQIPAVGGRPSQVVPWSNVFLDPVDWGNK